jgi:hypothetical protein
MIWEYKQIGSNHYGPGLLSTAGGLLFARDNQGVLPLWMREAVSRYGTSVAAKK